VPYALHAKTAETVSGGIIETDPLFSAWDKSSGISISESQISDLGTYLETESDPTVFAHVKAITTDNVSDWNDAHGWGDHSAEGYLTDYTESDPTVPAHVKAITSDNVSDWEAAHGWGDHSAEGYLTDYTETDPAVAANFDFAGAATGDLLQFDGTKWVKVTPDYISDYTVTEGDVTAHQEALSITENQISDLGNYIETETDPTVPAHVKAITSDNVSDWEAAHGWGDHSAEGYLTDYTETDPAVAANFDFTDAANGDLLQFDGTKWVKVTPDYISDYTVTETDVTAHEAALTVTESQISDLDHFTTADETDPAVAANFDFTDAANGDLLQFDGTKWVKVTPDYISDYTVTESDVTDHQAALSVTESQISDLGTYIETETDPTVTKYSVGDFAQGGIVFWVDETGQHGLVAAKVDQDSGSGIQWYNGFDTDTEAHGDGVYAGEMNTMLIIANQGSNSNDYAAGVCANYTVTESGVTYGDWYLPSKDELNKMYQNKATIDAAARTNGGSGFACPYYWSSSEDTKYKAYSQNWSDGDQGSGDKSNTSGVRAVRAF
jgi:hypothetical protein